MLRLIALLSTSLFVSAAPPAVPGYRLVFSEGFTHFDLSPDGRGSHTWYEGVWFNRKHAPLSNISASPSGLTLVWRRNQPSFDTSITTLSPDFRHALAWRYGYFEARMKWDVTPGAWPALWMIPVPDKNPKSGELDIFEGQGDHPHTFYGTIHEWTGHQDHPSADNHFPLPGTIDLSHYHTYGVLWLPGKVTWYLDDHPLHSEATPPVFDRQHYFLVVGMQEGSDWQSGNLSGVDSNSMALTVQWIRVWQM